jgi:hypothetical protein
MKKEDFADAVLAAHAAAESGSSSFVAACTRSTG